MIDVIIPVFRGLQQTQRCLQAVLSARCETPLHVVAIDDASPEPEISAELRRLSSEGQIELIVNAQNRGFVASVNAGMRCHPDRDVVLLNSDTEVSDGWLDRLAACAAREAQAGTITPFSNNATICSYPKGLQSNALPAGTSTAQLASYFARANAGASLDIPTAVGFCMLIRRECLEAVGLFDEEAFGTGYGEEVDFCMRAARAGYRNLLAADAFVFHEGEVSFTGSPARREKAQRIVDERYPEFQTGLADFIAREPTRPLRRAVDVARLAASAKPRVLLITHGWGGGVQKHVRMLSELIAGQCEVLLLQPDAGGMTLRWDAPGEEFQAWFEADELAELTDLLRGLGIARVHVHHVHGLPLEVLELPTQLGVPHDVTLHDFSSYCPQYHLADESGRYCGEPDEAACNRCIEQRPAHWSGDIASWRTPMARLLHGAARVIAPSHSVAERVRGRFPGVTITEWPHFENEPQVPRVPAFKIAILGGIASIKGLEVLEACAEDAARRGLPLYFRVLGHLGRPVATWPALPLSVTGTYPDDKLDELLALESPDAVLFLSQVPETYSYTLTAGMRTGLPIVATDLGAFAERLRGYRAAIVVPWNAPPNAFNDALLQMLRPAAPEIRIAANL